MTINIDELRRLAQAATSGEWYVKRGNYIYGRIEVTDGEEVWHPVIACTDDDEVNVNFEANAAFIAAANPAAISELLDRLEATEEDRSNFLVEIGKLCAQCDALRAKIEAMERQEPVAWTTKLALRHGANVLGFDACAGNLWGEKGVPLYTLPGAHPKPDCGEAGHDEGRCGNRQCLPGAQPAPSVPDGWKLVPIGPTQEMINHVIDERLDAIAAGKDHTFIDIYKTMLAAAPKPEGE